MNIINVINLQNVRVWCSYFIYCKRMYIHLSFVRYIRGGVVLYVSVNPKYATQLHKCRIIPDRNLELRVNRNANDRTYKAGDKVNNIIVNVCH